MADRNQVLLDFQECSNIENLEECMAILEQHDWNLMDAINSVMQLDTQTLPSEQAASEDFVTVSGNGVGAPIQVDGHSIQTDPWPGFNPPVDILHNLASSSSGFVGHEPAPRMLHFNVEYRDRTIPVVVKDSDTVGTIKSVLESEVNIEADKQELKGWGNRRVYDYSVLRDLSLPKESTLYLLTPEVVNPTIARNSNNASLSVTDMTERLSQSFTLKITHKDTSSEYSLNFPGTKSVLEVKQAIHNITNIPVRKQIWTGWPEDASDNTMTLAGCGINFPCHLLEFSASKEDNTRPKLTAQAVADDIEVGSSSDDEFEDAQDDACGFDDDMLVDTPTTKQLPLMPDDVDDELVLAEHFSKVFGDRYGFIHPVFFLGSLDDAIKEALQVKAKDRRLLAVYLHFDQSIQANVFCSQILCSETIVNYLSSNFVTWAWDMSSEGNKSRLLNMCTRHFGSMAATTLRNFKQDQLPLLLVITRTRSTNEVFTVIQGGITIDEVMTSLMHAVEVFQQQQNLDVQEEAEREARESVKLQQDMAYQESLAADRAKAESKRLEEEHFLQQELDKQIKEEIEANEKKQEEEEKKAIQMSLAEQLPEEPPKSCKQPVSQIRVRCPTGEMIIRRFLASTKLQMLLNFIGSKGFHIEEYKVLTTYPRRDVSTLDPNKTLEELKLFPQETLILEEK